MEAGDLHIRRAQPADAGAVTACVCEAYLHYIGRIGKQPGPMLVDYAEAIARHEVRVACRGDDVQGVIVLVREPGGFWLENIAVRPRAQGQGLGRTLLALAEAAAAQSGARALQLYTHERMTENRAWYERCGFVLAGHATTEGYARVYYRKDLG